MAVLATHRTSASALIMEVLATDRTAFIIEDLATDSSSHMEVLATDSSYVGPSYRQ